MAKRRNPFLYKMDATCLAAVYIAILWLIMPPLPDGLRHAPVDLVRAKSSRPMPAALREDATIVSLTRDGMIYVGYRPGQIVDLLDQDSASLHAGAERKIYLRVDARAKYAGVKAVIECLRSTGIENITFLTGSL
jgi:biopolymer transport protein ExbD